MKNENRKPSNMTITICTVMGAFIGAFTIYAKNVAVNLYEYYNQSPQEVVYTTEEPIYKESDYQACETTTEITTEATTDVDCFMLSDAPEITTTPLYGYNNTEYLEDFTFYSDLSRGTIMISHGYGENSVSTEYIIENIIDSSVGGWSEDGDSYTYYFSTVDGTDGVYLQLTYYFRDGIPYGVTMKPVSSTDFTVIETGYNFQIEE